jgi:pimeloyl-ACP methyl ester carboxylesterase
MQSNNANKAVNGSGLTLINGKPLNYKRFGFGSGPPIVFVHGLGGTMDFWTPLIQSLDLEQSHSLHLFDLEGHGLSPTSPISSLSIKSFAEDLNGIFEKADINSGATLVAHSMGCLVAVRFVLEHPGKISKLVLLGPPPSPLPEAASVASYQRATTARMQGMAAIVDAVATAGTSEATKTSNTVALAAVRISLLGQDPESYAKACTALADSAKDVLDFSQIGAKTLIVTGAEDKVSPRQLCEKLVAALPNAAGVKVLPAVGHWHVFEDIKGVASAVSSYLK